MAGLAKTQPARELFCDDLDQPIKDGRATSGTASASLTPTLALCLVRRMTSPEHELKLTRSLGMSEILTGDLVITPLDQIVTVTRRSEATTEAVSEGIEVPAEVTPAADALANDMPELLQRPDLGTVQHVHDRHTPQDRSGPAASPST